MKFEITYTIKQIVEIIGSPARVLGSLETSVSGINEIHMVEPGDITFVDHPKYYQKALESKATTIIINKETDCPEGKTLIITDDPFRDYNKIVLFFRKFNPSNQQISSTAIIGKNTLIMPGCFIGNHVKIGENCIIHPNVTIYDHSIIGNNVSIHANCVIGADAYYFKKRLEKWDKMYSCGRVIIEDNVELGALCSIDRGVSGDTIIGEGTKFDNQVQVGHDTQIGKHCLIGSQSAIAGVTVIEDECLIWAKVAINKDLVIKKGTVVLATSALDKDTEGNGKVYFGIPAEDARKKWRELAALRQLPDFMKEVRKKLKE
ncbi:MAG: UDP-3-O-(3-hydroxymyristoyl)glucosamine N-acyltransferase [Bacteroidales bacterium]|nr:UDP-3-O-(3-hydroxymyristoyl)glucosamine N-acyltransferase [Bacteroidales bacterium]MDY0215942.1 UDP-3-O-(3-hydroxymyristoyl)glucosamine N-acyltransferase [Bacteroidales bacterium]